MLPPEFLDHNNNAETEERTIKSPIKFPENNFPSFDKTVTSKKTAQHNKVPNSSKNEKTLIEHPLSNHKNFSTESYHNLTQINESEPKCGMYQTKSQKYEELVKYIMAKQIQIISMATVKNEGIILGEGGFGVVYEGEWSGSKVAIKEMFISYDEFRVMDAELSFMESIEIRN